jgi:hypothetical protein
MHLRALGIGFTKLMTTTDKRNYWFYLHLACELCLYVMSVLVAIYENVGLFFFVTPILLQILYWIMIYKKRRSLFVLALLLLCDFVICILPAKELVTEISNEGRNIVRSLFVNPGILLILISVLGVLSYWINVAKNHTRKKK